jgi:6-phosphofructokinase 1
MKMGDKVMDMTEVAITNARRLQLDCLVCLGGGGTQKNALLLHKRGGINVLTLPKTIDNDVALTDTSFGYDTARGIATEAIDRLHTTATSHHRIIVCEIMGHTAGWLALGAGISGGADVILIPEIPYDLEAVATHLRNRQHQGKRFSIVAIAEGALSRDEAKALAKGQKPTQKKPATAPNIDSNGIHLVQEPMSSRVARQIQQLTELEARVTQLGHVQRGGPPSPADRLLCTRLGTMAGELLMQGVYNVMVAVQGEECVPVPLHKVAGVVKNVPVNHPWVKTARLVGTCMGDVPGI